MQSCSSNFIWAALIFTSWGFRPQIFSCWETGVEQDGENHLHSFETALPGRSNNKFRETVVSFKDLLRLNGWLSLVNCVPLWLIHYLLQTPPAPSSVLNSSISQTERIKEQQRTLADTAPEVTGWVFGRSPPDVISFPCGLHPGEVCVYKMLPHIFLVNGYYLCMLTHTQYPLILISSQYWSSFRRLRLNSPKLFNNSGTDSVMVYCFIVNVKQTLNKNDNTLPF